MDHLLDPLAGCDLEDLTVVVDDAKDGVVELYGNVWGRKLDRVGGGTSTTPGGLNWIRARLRNGERNPRTFLGAGDVTFGVYFRPRAGPTTN